MTPATRTTLLGCLALALPTVALGEEEDIPVAVPVDEAESLIGIPVEPPPADPVFGDAVISESRQFRVRGGPGAARGSIAILAEQTRVEFLRITGENDAGFKIPVNINIVGNPGEPAPPRTIATAIHVGEQGYEIRINVHTGRGLDVGGFQHAVTAALIYERALVNRPADDLDTPLLTPPWLIEGLREANQWRLGNGDRRLYDRLFQSGGFFILDDLLATTEADHQTLDGATRAAFQASSGALVMALIEQPDGLPAFRKFLGEVALYAGEMPSLLRRHFPELNLSENSMEKWWQLQLASMGAAKLTESLTIAETEAALDQALRLRFRNAEGEMLETSLHDWSEMDGLDETERFSAVRMAEDALVRLSYRCFPTYRPVIAAYQDALNKIARKTDRPGTIAIRLDELAATRQTIIEKSERARDYLDWFEITRARETSGAFDDFLRLKADLRENPRTPRHDPVTGMLDRFDTIFHRHVEDRPQGWSAFGDFPPPALLLPP